MEPGKLASECTCGWDSNNLGLELRDKQGRRAYLVSPECPVHGEKRWGGSDKKAREDVVQRVLDLREYIQDLEGLATRLGSVFENTDSTNPGEVEDALGVIGAVNDDLDESIKKIDEVLNDVEDIDYEAGE